MHRILFALLAVSAFVCVPLAHTAEPATVTGKWHFVLDTPGGDREVDSILEQTAEKVTGKWAVTADQKEGGDPVAGTFVEKKLNLEFAMQSEIGPGTMKIAGVLADDGSMSGNWAFADYAGSFKATKTVEGAPAK